MLNPRHSITLKVPFEHDGQPIKILEMRRPKVRDIKAMAGGKGAMFERLQRMIADLAEIPPDAVEEIDAEDFQAVQKWLEPLIGAESGPNDAALRAMIAEMMAGN
jgi:hypothetical protein